MMETGRAVAPRPVSACTVGDFIHHANVVSKTYQMPAGQVQNALADFLAAVVNADMEPASLPFFIMDALEGGWLKMKLYVPVTGASQGVSRLPEGLHFDSYFGTDHMAALSVAGSPEENMSEAYVQLFGYLLEHALKATTPVFHVLGGGRDSQYVILKVGCIGA